MCVCLFVVLCHRVHLYPEILVGSKANVCVTPYCRCNRTGSCKGCTCVKAGHPCTSCLPSKLGLCKNRSSNSPCIQQPSNVPTPINAYPSTDPPELAAAVGPTTYSDIRTESETNSSIHSSRHSDQSTSTENDTSTEIYTSSLRTSQ